MKKTTGIIRNFDLKKPQVKALYWFLFLFMLVVAAICILPPIWVLLSSMKDVKEFFTIPPTIIPKTFHPEKLLKIWKELSFFKYYINTFLYTFGTLFFSLFFNAIVGFVLSKLRPKGGRYLFVLLLWTMMLPNTLGMVPVFKNIINFPVLNINLTNTFWPLWMMYGANPFYVIIFKSFFDGIPQSLVEAAWIDGCSSFGIFYKIILPLSKPVMMTIAIFTVNRTWADFFWPFLVLKSNKLWTVIITIFKMKASYPMDYQFAALTFVIIPPIIMFIFFQKYIMQGFTLSGIKG